MTCQPSPSRSRTPATLLKSWAGTWPSDSRVKRTRRVCPFHDDHRPSFDVDAARQRYRCWSCGKNGDVFTFIMEQERVGFREAWRCWRARAGITLEKLGQPAQNADRARMIEAVQWAADLYQACLLDGPEAEAARVYLGQRKLTGETVRRFGLGFSPPAGDWLAHRRSSAAYRSRSWRRSGWWAAGCKAKAIMTASATGSCSRSGTCGGRWWVSGAASCRPRRWLTGPRNTTTRRTRWSSARAGCFTDSTRRGTAAASHGFIAVVEGYTDVLMAHQMGVAPVVSTMGDGVGRSHGQEAAAAGCPTVELSWCSTRTPAAIRALDRALEIFVSQEVDLCGRDAARGNGPLRSTNQGRAGPLPPGPGPGSRCARFQIEPGDGDRGGHDGRRSAPRDRRGAGHHRPGARDAGSGRRGQARTCRDADRQPSGNQRGNRLGPAARAAGAAPRPGPTGWWE